MGDRSGVRGGICLSLEALDLASKRRSSARVFRFDICSHHAAFLTDTRSSLVEEHILAPVDTAYLTSWLPDEERIEFRGARLAGRERLFRWREEHEDRTSAVVVLLVCARIQGSL
jgi:hypothetical protein